MSGMIPNPNSSTPLQHAALMSVECTSVWPMATYSRSILAVLRILVEDFQASARRLTADLYAARVAKTRGAAENRIMFKEGQRVRANLAGIQAGGVLFHAAVTDTVGNIVRQTSENPSVCLVRLLFSFKGVNEVEVPADRLAAF